MGPHSGFIVAAYAMAGMVIAGLIVRAFVDWRVQRRALDAFEARGLTRRSLR